MVAARFPGSESSGAFGDMTLTRQVGDLKQVCAYIGTAGGFQILWEGVSRQ